MRGLRRKAPRGMGTQREKILTLFLLVIAIDFIIVGLNQAEYNRYLTLMKNLAETGQSIIAGLRLP